MAEQTNSAIQIGQLNLRVPGSSADSANRVADGIAHGLGQRIPTGMQRHLGALSVRVQVPAGATEAEMSDAVAGAIVTALRRGEARS
jgi:hypothetical protein